MLNKRDAVDNMLHLFIVTTCFYMFVIGSNAAWVKEMENPDLFEGDILLDPDERKSGNAYASIKGSRWPNPHAIPYDVWPSVSTRVKNMIPKAIAEYEKHTCLRFIKRTTEEEYLDFRAGRGCSSPVGFRKRRYNAVSLASGCYLIGTVMHEMGHSLGMYHEMSRPDRDQYIDIVWDNVKERNKFNFNKIDSSMIDSLGTPYDYLSMMHYGKTAFGQSKRVTIKTKNKFYQDKIGQQNGFSEIDIQQVNLMYCNGTTSTKTTPSLAVTTTKTTSKHVVSTTKTTHVTSKVTSSISCKNRSNAATCKYWKAQGFCERSPSIRKTCCGTCSR